MIIKVMSVTHIPESSLISLPGPDPRTLTQGNHNCTSCHYRPDLPVVGLQMNGLKQCTCFCVWLLWLSVMFLRFIILSHIGASFIFHCWVVFLCVDIPHVLYPLNRTTCPVSTQPFMNFWILSILGLLFLKKLLEAFTLCLFISPGVNMYNQFLILKETARQFSKVLIPYDTPNSQWDSSPWPRVGCQGGVSLAGGSYFITDIVYHCCCMVIIKSRLPLSGSVIVSKFCTDSAPTPLRPCPIQTACTACPWYNTARPQSFSP